MKYLFDTNLFLDILLARESASIVERVIIGIGTDEIGISDFSLFSIGIYLDRKKKSSFFVQFIDDMILSGGMEIVSLPPKAILEIPNICNSYHLDFDDAYQYQAARFYHLILVSRDKDFDRVPDGRITPDELNTDS